MSKRRPHWDDYLLASVMIHCSDIYQCHDIIAAVEDWHRDRWTGVCESPEEVVRELKQAQAAIQRVRELHGRLEVTGLSGPSFVCLECYDAEWPCATIRALDGDA